MARSSQPSILSLLSIPSIPFCGERTTVGAAAGITELRNYGSTELRKLRVATSRQRTTVGAVAGSLLKAYYQKDIQQTNRVLFLTI